jgi:hypothetical protein
VALVMAMKQWWLGLNVIIDKNWHFFCLVLANISATLLIFSFLCVITTQIRM